MVAVAEPTKLAPTYWLRMKRVGKTDTVDIEITAAEHAMSYENCVASVEARGAMPGGRWEMNQGIVRLGGMLTLNGRTPGRLNPGDIVDDGDEYIVNPGDSLPLVFLTKENWTTDRTGGLTLTRKDAVDAPITIENGELTVTDESKLREDDS